MVCPSHFAGRGHPLQQRDRVNIAESVPPETMIVTFIKVPVNAFDAIDSCKFSDSRY